ncbi:uncharacterized protein EV420DRAFT_1648410 [Desarmillaria tabescens]|uniref:JmjC domain-containing protein n=1 Tax=Armillaria tabescens TaxID=1929756 RepID=A0AA39JN04_ARMTA|nr:uncharacterized protein EV420DRAFT_1648410 [Desarmillaria tabescens]KAK0445272.1 hypothetical protein EV420DRAFT_1648410 [Desarmillaria tabescens]
MHNVLKKAKIDPRFSFSPTGILLPEVWVPRTNSCVTFEYFPLVSNPEEQGKLALFEACYRIPTWLDPVILSMKFNEAFENPSQTMMAFKNANFHLYDTRAYPLDWSLRSLSEIGDIDQVHVLEGYDHQDVSMMEGLKKGVAFSTFSLCLVMILPSTTLYILHFNFISILSSHICAFDNTSDPADEIYKREYPASATSFWFVARKGATTEVGTDSLGIATVIEVLFEVRGEWEPGFIPDAEFWTAEIVLLEPGSVFYMRPNTHHAVVTLENSIVKGHHFYSTVTLSRTVWGWVHTCMFGDMGGLPFFELQHILLRMMIYLGVLVGDEGPECKDSHFPGLNNRGMLNFIALGNFCLFLPAFNSGPFKRNEEVTVTRKAIRAYLSIIQRLRDRHCLLLLDEHTFINLHPLSAVRQLDIADFARTSAVQFAHSLILEGRRAFGLTASMFELTVRECLPIFLNIDPNFFKIDERRRESLLLTRRTFWYRNSQRKLMCMW